MMRTFPTLLLACLLPLAACSRGPAPEAGEDDGFLARTTRQAIDQARDELATADIGVGGDGSGVHFGDGDRTAHLPPAKITPQGEFLVDGAQVEIDATQRELLLAHRANIITLTDAGLRIGAQGASLGLNAASGAIGAVLSGKGEEFGQRMEAEGERIEAAARTLCAHMPALLESQQALAAALPAFQPYATMDAGDIDECRAGSQDDAAADAADRGA